MIKEKHEKGQDTSSTAIKEETTNSDTILNKTIGNEPFILLATPFDALTILRSVARCVVNFTRVYQQYFVNCSKYLVLFSQNTVEILYFFLFT